MNKLKLLFIIYISFQSYIFTSAQVDFTTQGYFNSFSINPAMISIDDKRIITYFSKDVDASNNYFSYEFPIEDLNSNIGISIDRLLDRNSRETYVLNRFNVAYSYKFKLSEVSNLRLGFQFSHIAGSNFNNPSATKEWKVVPDYSFGFVFIYKKIRVGGSLNNLFDKEYRYPNSFDRFQQISHAVFTSSYEIRVNKSIDLLPAVLVRLDERKISLIDLTTYLSVRKKWFLGVTYRDADDNFYDDEKEWIGIVGINFRKKLNIQISIYNVKGRGSNSQFLTQFKF